MYCVQFAPHCSCCCCILNHGLCGWRAVCIVSVRCKNNSDHPHAVIIYLQEPKTCEYVLVVSILCIALPLHSYCMWTSSCAFPATPKRWRCVFHWFGGTNLFWLLFFIVVERQVKFERTTSLQQNIHTLYAEFCHQVESALLCSVISECDENGLFTTV